MIIVSEAVCPETSAAETTTILSPSSNVTESAFQDADPAAIPEPEGDCHFTSLTELLEITEPETGMFSFIVTKHPSEDGSCINTDMEDGVGFCGSGSTGLSSLLQLWKNTNTDMPERRKTI
jgi:hypothetical protein